MNGGGSKIAVVLCLLNRFYLNDFNLSFFFFQLFRLTEKTAETCEVTFSDIFKNSASQIWELESERPDPIAPAAQRVGKRNMKALSRAAAVGVASASLSHISEDMLSAPCLPPLPRPKTAYAKGKNLLCSVLNSDISYNLIYS